MPKRVNSYDPDAIRPVPGSIWAWYPEKPHAAGLLRVDEVFWNGEEWYVKTRRLVESSFFPRMPGDDGSAWNDLSRFWEACHYVARFPGPPHTQGVTRRGSPVKDEIKEEK